MLNISKKIIIGWNSLVSAAISLPEASVIPVGTSAAEKKKIEKFSLLNKNIVEFNNVPLPGFTVVNVSKKTWSSGESSWLIIDPRGFTVRISSENIASIISVSGITEGLIQEKCVWARDNAGTVLSLIPVSSKDYDNAVNNTEMIETKVDMADVQIGDTVFLQNGLTGQYMGTLSLFCSVYDHTEGRHKVRSMLRREIIEVEPGKFHYQTDTKILKVLEKTATPMTREDSAAYLNNIIKTNTNAYFTSTQNINGRYYSYGSIVKFVSIHSPAKVTLELKEIDIVEAKALFNEGVAYADSGLLVLEDALGKYMVDYPYYSSSGRTSHSKFHVGKIIKIEDDVIILPVPKYTSIHTKPVYSIDNFTKFYKIVKCVKKDTYI